MFTSLYTTFALQSPQTWTKKPNRGAPRAGFPRIERRGFVSRIFTLIRRATDAASIERGIGSECWQHVLLQVTEALAGAT